MEKEVKQKSHHQFTDRGYDYVAFEVRCSTCHMLLFEFVHHQQYRNSQDRILALPAPNPPMGAQSWYKPAVKVVCTPRISCGGDEIAPFHGFIKVTEGEDRNQAVTSRQMSQAEFEKWSEQSQ